MNREFFSEFENRRRKILEFGPKSANFSAYQGNNSDSREFRAIPLNSEHLQ